MKIQTSNHNEAAEKTIAIKTAEVYATKDFFASQTGPLGRSYTIEGITYIPRMYALPEDEWWEVVD